MSSTEKAQIFKLLDRKDLLEIVVSCLSETIKGYTQSPVSSGKPFIGNKETIELVAVAGLIRLKGEDFSLELILGFSKDLFLSFYSNMFQMSVEEISPENQDLAGEILNIAFGMMDPKFRELNCRLYPSFPKIYSGNDLRKILNSIEAQSVTIPYSTEDNKKFFIELYVGNSIRVEWEYE